MKYRVEVSMFPGKTRDVDAAELVDLQHQHLLVGDPIELGDDGEPLPAAEADDGEQDPGEPPTEVLEPTPDPAGKPAGRKPTDRKAGE